MTMTLLDFDDMSRRILETGWRRLVEASQDGTRCEGNLPWALGSGGGEVNAGVGRSWDLNFRHAETV